MFLCRSRIVLFALCGIAFAWPASRLEAQFAQPFAQSTGANELGNIFSPAPRELRQRIKYAKEALEQGRFTQASALLGNLVAGRLEEIDNQDYFMQVEGDAQRMVSIKAEAQRMIGNMPAGGREVYELQFGAEARQMLNKALAEGDAQQLAEVTRMFFHTQAGYEARLLLGRYYLDRGKPLAAALTLQNLAPYPNVVAGYDPDFSLLLATCWMLADMPERARETLAQLQERLPQAELQVQGLAVQLPNSDQDLLGWLEAQLGGRPEFARSATQQWAMHRGEPARNAQSEGGAPIYHPRWIATLNADIDEVELIDQVEENDFIAEEVAPLPAIQPLAVGETVMVRTPSYLMGINFRTGKRVWTFPWNEASDWQLPNSPAGNAATQGLEQRRELLKQRLFYDSPYGQLASDGKAVFMIDDLGFAAIGGRSHFIGRGGVREQNPYAASQFNQLMALDVAREGALKWTIGGQTGEDEPELAGAFFLGPPLPLMGQLFVLAEINGEIRLVVVDAETGRYEWSQQLAVTGPRNILADQSRRLAGASPSFADGVLVCPTSAGAVVAVDISTRTLLWGFTYESQRVALRYQRNLQPRRTEEVSVESWTDATVAIDSGKVILTPRESEQLYCLDLLTGKPLWPAKHRSELVFHACIHDGIAVFVGNNRVAGIRLDDGTPAWNENVMLEALPSGRGFYSEHFYYLPTTDAKLLKIDLNTGEVAHTYETEHALGNLICFKEQLISLTPSSLETYFQAEPLRELVEAQLRKNPDDPDALAQHAELLLQDGNQEQALKSLRRAYELAPDNFRIARLLSKTILAALRADFAEYREVAIELRPMLKSTEQQTEYLRLMAAGYRDLGESEKAFETYMKLATPASLASSQNSLEEIDRHHSVRRDRWLQAQLRDLLNHADEKQRPAIQTLITNKLADALATDTIASLGEANDLFGFLPQSEPVRLRLAELYLEAGRPLAAEVMLTHLQQAADRQVALSAALRLAQLLEQAGKLPEALRQHRYLVAQFSAQQPLPGGQTAEQQLAAFLDRHSGTKLLGTAGNWPNGRAETTLENTRAIVQPSYERIFPIGVRQQTGPSPLGMHVAYDQTRTDLLITSGWGRELQRASLARVDGRTSRLTNYNVASYDALGHLIVASVGAEIVAVDLMAPLREQDNDTSATLWRHQTSHSGETVVRVQTKGLENPWGSARYVGIDDAGRRVGAVGPITRHGVCVHQSLEVTCLDPLTGEPIWSRHDAEPGSELYGDADHLFVVSPQGKTRVLNMLDGSELGTRQLPGESQRWQAVGRNVLCWERNLAAQRNDRLAMYLLDALTGEKLWSKEFPLGTRATMVDHDELAFLTPQGKFELITIADGSQRTVAELEFDALLSSLYVLRSSKEYIVAAGLQRPRARANNSSIQPQPPGLYAPLLDGKLWCFDRDTAAMRWQAAADIDRFGLPLDQPGETPVLVMLRQVRTLSRTGTREQSCGMLLIDKRDGRQLFAQNDFGNTKQAYSYSLLGEPAQGRVTVSIPGYEVHVDYTQDPRPPQPPAQSDLFSVNLTVPPRPSRPVVEVEARREPLGGARNPFGDDPKPVGDDPFGGAFD